MKTGKEIQSDIIALLKDSSLAAQVSGDVYRNGYRPRNSGLEDIVVTFVTGLVGEIQEGVVSVNVFVKDIEMNAGNGVLVENGARTAELERLAQDWVDSLTAGVSGYKFTLSNSIHTSIDSIAGEHFVAIRLGYRLYENN